MAATTDFHNSTRILTDCPRLSTNWLTNRIPGRSVAACNGPRGTFSNAARSSGSAIAPEIAPRQDGLCLLSSTTAHEANPATKPNSGPRLRLNTMAKTSETTTASHTPLRSQCQGPAYKPPENQQP